MNLPHRIYADQQPRAMFMLMIVHLKARINELEERMRCS
jgi:hypothetical protein